MSLYLVPATRINLEQTIERSVPLSRFQGLLAPPLLEALMVATDSKGLFCWAMTEAHLKPFLSMRPGDDVLFTERGTSAFTHYGQVIGKTHNRALGETLWPFVKSKPWELIYFLRRIKLIRIPKQTLVMALGYAANDVVAGSRMVHTERLERYEQQYGPLHESLGFSADSDDLLVEPGALDAPAQEFSSEDILSLTKRRHAHQRWAKTVKYDYRYRCAISGIHEREFLVAGHIVPWSADKTSRLDPANGLCFSVFYDRAFEAGYFTLGSDLRIDVSPILEPETPLGKYLCHLQGKAIALPQQHRPRQRYLDYHRDVVFRR